MKSKNGLNASSNKIVVIVGPTGSGKSDVALRLAEELDGEIINADSRQIYRGLTIGTAKPDESFFKSVPHHLFDMMDPHDHWDASCFYQKADELIKEITSRSKLPIIVGGTGLYIKALLFGLFDGPEADEGVRSELEEQIKSRGLLALHEDLKSIDPEAYEQIHANDATRIIRALEVFKLTGKTISEHQKEHAFSQARYDYLKIGLSLEREKLYDKINKRVDHMLEQGLEDEVKGLIQDTRNYSLLKRAIGYREWFAYFDGQTSYAKTIDLIKQHTRNFAKRQLTWFRKEEDIQWMEASDYQSIVKKVKTFLE